MAYRYQAINSAGHTMTNVIEARSSHEAADILRERGLFVTHIDQVDDSGFNISLPSGKDPQSGVKAQDIVFFTQQMSMLIRSGARIVQASKLTPRRRRMRLMPWYPCAAET